MLGRFETLGSNFSNEIHFCEAACVLFYYIKKSTSHTPSHKVTKKEKSIFYSSKHISSHQMATNVRKIRDLGSNFSHKTAGLLASFSTIKKIYFSLVTIMTTRLTGGLNRGYKPRLQASASRRWLSLCSSLIAFDSSLAS